MIDYYDIDNDWAVFTIQKPDGKTIEGTATEEWLCYDGYEHQRGYNDSDVLYLKINGEFYCIEDIMKYVEWNKGDLIDGTLREAKERAIDYAILTSPEKTGRI